MKAKTLLSASLLLGSLFLQAAERPNLILFVSDDHGTDALGCYGNPVIKTPNMDQLAKDGVLFNNAYCTSASCAASRSVILTGMFGHATGSYGHVHDYHHFSTFDSVQSLPVLLKKAGYLTARIGKYHVAPESVYHFDNVLKADPRSTLEMADACADVINSDKPFFLYFCPDDPHRGHPFKPDPWDEPNTFGNKPGGYPGEIVQTYSPDEVIIPEFLPDSIECRREVAEYYQSISRIDQGLGKLLGHVNKAGKADNTIVIYLSDNGMAFPGAKTTVYEPGIKLPCIVKDPTSGLKGKQNNSMISWVDLTPTLLDYAGVDLSEHQFHGRSFRGILGEEKAEGWDRIFAAHNFHELTMYYPMRVIRDGKYKLIWNVAYQLDYPFASDLWAASTWQRVFRDGQEYYGNKKVKDYLQHAQFELFDLEEDPGESKNLAKKKKHAATLERLKTEMKTFQIETRDPWQIMWSNESQVQGTGVNL